MAPKLGELPANAVKYIRRVEELTRTPVTLLSTSPERDDTILVTDPFGGWWGLASQAPRARLRIKTPPAMMPAGFFDCATSDVPVAGRSAASTEQEVLDAMT